MCTPVIIMELVYSGKEVKEKIDLERVEGLFIKASIPTLLRLTRDYVGDSCEGCEYGAHGQKEHMRVRQLYLLFMRGGGRLPRQQSFFTSKICFVKKLLLPRHPSPPFST